MLDECRATPPRTSILLNPATKVKQNAQSAAQISTPFRVLPVYTTNRGLLVRQGDLDQFLTTSIYNRSVFFAWRDGTSGEGYTLSG
jgi:hypothetical protein